MADLYLEVVRDEPRLERMKHWYTGKDGYYDDFFGLNKRRYCTEKYLRDVLRRLFDQKDTRYLMVWIITPNHKYEGVKISSWSNKDESETVGFQMIDGDNEYNWGFDITNIQALHILY